MFYHVSGNLLPLNEKTRTENVNIIPLATATTKPLLGFETHIADGMKPANLASGLLITTITITKS